MCLLSCSQRRNLFIAGCPFCNSRAHALNRRTKFRFDLVQHAQSVSGSFARVGLVCEGVEKEWLFAMGLMSLVAAKCVVVCRSYAVAQGLMGCSISQLFDNGALSSFFRLVTLFGLNVSVGHRLSVIFISCVTFLSPPFGIHWLVAILCRVVAAHGHIAVSGVLNIDYKLAVWRRL